MQEIPVLVGSLCISIHYQKLEFGEICLSTYHQNFHLCSPFILNSFSTSFLALFSRVLSSASLIPLLASS